MAGFFKKAGKTITGGDDIAATARALRKRQRGTMDTARAALIPGRRERAKLPTDSTDLSERFAVAQAYYGVDGVGLTVRARAAGRMFNLCMFIGLLAAGGCIVNAVQGGTASAALSFASIAVLMVAHCLKYGHANWQIRTRRLGSVGEYLRRPSDWLPMNEGAKP